MSAAPAAGAAARGRESADPTIAVLVPLEDTRGDVAEHLRTWTHGQTLERDRFQVVIASDARNEEGDRAVETLLASQDALVRVRGANLVDLWNAAAARADAEWIVLTEAHCLGARDCLAALMRAVARYADIANIGFEMTLAEYAHKRAVLTAHCHEVGRDPDAITLSHNTRVVIAPTRDALEERLWTEAARFNQPVEVYRASLAHAVVGTPEECVAKLTPYVESGIRYFFLLFPHPIQLDDLRLFAERVMARF